MPEQSNREDPPSRVQATEKVTAQGFAVGDVVDSRYRILGSLGVGGMAVVYSARDEKLDVDVALKLLSFDRSGDQSTQERFRQELLLSRKVSHRNVVRIHDLGHHGDQMFITMDLVRGASLREVLDRDGALPLDQALDWFRQALRGVRAAHQAGIVHRDLKPANLLIEGERVLISDFGIAQSADAATLTATGLVVGTLDYLSPEQALGTPVDERSDLYTLGLILYEMISGELGEGRSGGSLSERLAQRIFAHEGSLPDLGDGVPRRVRDVIEKLLRRNPDQRFRSADEVLEALDADLDQPLKQEQTADRPALLSRVGIFVAGLLLVAMAVGLWWVLARSSPDAPEVGEAALSAPDPSQLSVLSAGSQSVAFVSAGDETLRPWVDWIGRSLHRRLMASGEVRVVDPDRVARILHDLEMRSERWSTSRLRQLADLLDVGRVITLGLGRTGDGLRLTMLSFDRSDGELEELEALEQADPGALQRMAEDALATRFGWPNEGQSEAPAAETVAVLAAVRGALLERDPETALDLLEGAATTDGAGNLDLQLLLAEALEADGRTDLQERRLLELLSMLEGRDDPLARSTRARALVALGAEDAAGACDEALSTVPTELTLALRCSEHLGDSGRLEPARALLTELVTISPGYGRAWYLLGKFSIMAGESRVAVDDYLVRALVAENRVGDDRGRADVHNALGVGLRQLGELDAAEENYETAAALRRETGDLAGYATTLRNLALIATLRGDTARAEQRLQEGLEIFEARGDRRGQASMVNDLGVLAEEQGRYREALDRYTETLRLYREIGSSTEVAQSLNNVGFAYYLLGDFEHGLAFAQQALKSSESGGDPFGQALALQVIGQLEFARGGWPDAEQAYQLALDLGRQLEDPAVESVSLGQLGRLAFEQGRFAESMKSLAEAIDVLDAIGDLRGVAEYRLAEIGVRLAVGDWEQSLQSLDELEEILASVDNTEQRARAAILHAQIARQREQPAETARWAAEAVARARESGSDRAVLEAELDRATLEGAAPGVAADLRTRADQLGHARMRLLAFEVEARALVDTRRLAEARSVLAEVARLVRRTGGAWRRQHVLLGLRLESQPDMAEEERAQVEESLRSAVGELTRDLDERIVALFGNDPGNRRALDAADRGSPVAPD